MSDYKEKSKKYSGGIKALLSDWMIVFLFIVLFILCCFNSNFRTYPFLHLLCVEFSQQSVHLD